MSDTRIQPGCSKVKRTSGFTLIELLVAIAVTAVLLTLLFGPLVASFFFTGDAQTEAAAQSTARTTMEQISRELGSAAGIRDTSNKYMNMVVMNQSGGETLARSYGAYLDIVPPRPQTPSQNAEYDPTLGQQYNPTDPNNKTVSLNPATGAEVTPPIILSLAPGTGIVRYFVGLRYPIDLQYDKNNPPATTDPQPYYNPYEATSAQVSALRQDPTYGTSYTVKNNLTNTYILYRAEVQPTVPYEVNGVVQKDASGNTEYVPNTELFSCVYGQNDPNGTAGQPEPAATAATDTDAQPVLDDPDFFRVVSTSDVNPITINPSTGAGTDYTAQQAQEHNQRVYYWSQVGKPVIGASVADLIAPPRDGRGQVQYYYVDSTGKPVLSPAGTTNPGGAEVWPAVPTNSFVDDTSGNPTIPVERMSVSFGPALVSNDTLAAASNQYASQGAGANQLDLAGTPPYIPTVFQAAYGQWQGTPVLTIYQNDQNGNPIIQTGAAAQAANGVPYYMTGEATSTDLAQTLSNNANLNRSIYTNPQPGDLMEYDSEAVNLTTNLPDNPVYDVTLSAPIQGAKHYIALTFSPASGTVSFAINAQPAAGYVDSNNTSGNPYWILPVVANGTANGAQQGLFFNGTNNEVDFRQLTGSYLNQSDPNMIAGAPYYPNPPAAPATFQLAQIVVNSDRVYGPDMSQTGTNSPSGVQPTDLPLVPYTRVSATSSAGLQANQYAVNDTTGEFFFAPPSTATATGEGPPPGSSVQIAFAYQDNLLDNEYTVGTTNATTNTDTPDTVRATYHTGKLTQVTVGIRLYNGSSHRAAFFSMSNRLQVANASR